MFAEFNSRKVLGLYKGMNEKKDNKIVIEEEKKYIYIHYFSK